MTRQESPPAPARGADADPLGRLRDAVVDSATELRGEGPLQGLRLERPPRVELGDYSTNAPMLLAPPMRTAPRDVAGRLAELVSARLGPALERTEVAGPGFLNLFVSDRWRRAALTDVLVASERFGAGVPASGEHLLVEFVSANPTGPITVAAGRHAAYGDALCRVLEFVGHRVEREYYVNDQGGQVQRFAASIQARARGEEPAEDGYHGAYVTELAARIPGAADLDLDELARRGAELMIEAVRASLERFGVRFDRFFSERSLHQAGGVETALRQLDEHGRTYRHEGAVWLRTTDHGDDKDRVLTRSTGEGTYFSSDIAYHEHKRARGYDRIVDVLGADHHGYMARMQAAWEALGGQRDRFEILIMQLVNLTERGRRVAMSKRGGEFVTLDDLMDDIGVDAARFFLLQRSHDTTLDLDLALAREQSQDNPVYYVQYAHARIASILRRAGDDRVAAALAADLHVEREVLHPSARALLARLLAWPEEVRLAADRRAPHRLTAFALETAQGFSAFYRDCRVVGAAEEGGDEDLRIALSVAAQRLLATALGLLGVSAPEEM